MGKRTIHAAAICFSLILLAACASAAVPPSPAPTSPPTIAPSAIPPTTTTVPIATPTIAPKLTATSTPPQLELKQIDTRPGVTLRFVFSSPSNPKAALILFPGGDGRNMFAISGAGIKLGGNFVVRNMPQFVQQGFAAAIIDVPSDEVSGMAPVFRVSSEHAQDISKLMEYLGTQGLNSVYFVGTSNGTISENYLGTAIKEPRLKGIVLTSTITGTPRTLVSSAFNTIALNKISVPVLIVHHHDDGCSEAPFAAAFALPAKMTSSPRVDLIEVRGGSPPQSGPCDPFAQHGYFGIEEPVIQAIADWIIGKPVPSKIGP